MSDVVLAIHEAGGQDVTMQKELAYSLVSGGGQTGSRVSVYCCDTVGALQAVDYKGPNRQYVESGKLIIEQYELSGNNRADNGE